MGADFLSAFFPASGGSHAAASTDDPGRRRLALLQAAFDVIAELGFEGLRTRAVAERAGVNVATLHYYFPTKQALVEGVAQFLGARFSLLHGDAPAPTGYAALDRLRQEFADGRYYMEHERGMLAVLQEFTSRGRRDAEVQKIVNMMRGYWRKGLEDMVRTGLAEGTFRPELDAEETIVMLMAAFSGLGDRWGEEFDLLGRAMERWLLTDEVWNATREVRPTQAQVVAADEDANREDEEMP